MTNPTTHGQVPAIQRYKIGYRSDEWGQRSSTPSGIPDASGSWVRYADHIATLAAGQATAAQAVVQDDLITLRKPTTSAELLWLLKLAHLVISDVDKALEETFAPAQPAAEASRFGSPELQAMIIARCVEKDQADSGFDHKTAADFLSGKTVSDDALRKFVAASRGAHDARAALHAKMLSLQGELASREAEIALLKRSLLDAEAAAPQPSTTAQSAESVPAVSDLPPLPAPDLRDVGTKPQEIKEFLKGYATEYARTAIAASAPADSVQEDSARLDFLIEQRAYVVSDPDACPGYWLHWAMPDGRTWVQGDEHPTPRAAIDAGRKQGGV